MSNSRGLRGVHVCDARTRLAVARTAAVCIVAGAVVLVAGAANGPWLCVPLALADRPASRIAQGVDGVTVGLATVHASLGVALFPFDGSRAPELLAAADQRPPWITSASRHVRASL